MNARIFIVDTTVFCCGPNLFGCTDFKRRQLIKLSLNLLQTLFGVIRRRTGVIYPPDPCDGHLWDLLASEPSGILITGDRLLIENSRPQSSVVSPATWDKTFRRLKQAYA